MTPRIIEMSDTEKLRVYATRLMAFALKAVSGGDMSFAERLAARASECLTVLRQPKDSQLGDDGKKPS
jgi:hypothetical protein